MDDAHGNGRLERRNLDDAQRAKAQLFLDATFRQQRDAEARFDEALLGRQAVDRDDFMVLDAGRGQPALEEIHHRLARPARGERDPSFAGKGARLVLAAVGQPVPGAGDDDERFLGDGL